MFRRTFYAIAVWWAINATSVSSAQVWIEQGPGPTLNGQEEGITGNPVSGAIQAIAIDPTDANTIYVGGTNSGVWKTTNAMSPTPTWTPLTDTALPTLGVNSLALSPLTSTTLYVGSGSASSFGASAGYGVGKSIDGGNTWAIMASTTFLGRRINSIVPTSLFGGNLILAGTSELTGGVYVSINGAISFTRISGNGTSGLPNAGVSSVVADPTNTNRFYAGVTTEYGGGASAGVYISNDGGTTWSPVNNGLTGLGTSFRILLAVQKTSGNVYAAIISNASPNRGHLSGVFFSTNQGDLWTSMGVPSPEAFPGGQGGIHGAIVADPANPNIVFIAGDRQNTPFQNGCTQFSANAFQGDTSLPGNSWTSVVCNGAHGSSPHADARDMVFDLNGNLLQANDGGIFRLADPNNNADARRWFSLNGNIRPAEFHSAAYDSLTRTVFGGTQDTGTPMQLVPGGFTFADYRTGDGGRVAVDADQTTHPGTSIRYSSFQFLGGFNRSTWDSANTFLGFVPVGLNITSGTGAGQTLFQFDTSIQFYNPFVLNRIDLSRMLIGTTNIYESANRGDSLTNLGAAGASINGLSYGSRVNGVPQVGAFYVGAGSQILHRVTLGGPISTLIYPGSTIRSLVMDPQNYRNVYVLDTLNRVWASFDEGVSWTNISVNLASLGGALGPNLRSIEIYSPNPSPRNTVLMVGGLDGVFMMRRPGAAGAVWQALVTLPHALVLDLRYDYTSDVLVAGLLGRGVWTLTGFFTGAVSAAAPSNADGRETSFPLGPEFEMPPPPPPEIATEDLQVSEHDF